MDIGDYTFGIISEGPTDQKVIKNILAGFTNNKDIFFNPLQPKEGEPGNWDKVFKFCASDEFKSAFAFNDFIIVQIDTDFMSGDSVGKDYKIDLKDLNIAEIVEAFKNKLIDLIGIEFYEKYSNNILFAIAVNEIECWLLPIYYQDKKAAKWVNCLGTLNQKLNREHDFTIDKNAKGKTDYAKISKPFLKKKDLLNYAKNQASFQLFIDELNTKVSLKP